MSNIELILTRSTSSGLMLSGVEALNRTEIPYVEGMKITGKEITPGIYEGLRPRIEELILNGTPPKLGIIVVGEDPASKAYVNQKIKTGKELEILFDLKEYPISVTTDQLSSDLSELNDREDVHGVIIQQPLPQQVNGQHLINETAREKDVDGFRNDSPFTPPVALAVWKILEEAYKRILLAPDKGVSLKGYSLEKIEKGMTFSDWLHRETIVFNGKGKTAGRPIIETFRELGLSPTIIDSKTQNPDDILRSAGIIISAVGKPDIIRKNNIKPGAIVIGVGMHKGEDGKLHADYDPIAIARKASIYTPVPGGVGPVNVAMLLSNVVTAAENQCSTK